MVHSRPSRFSSYVEFWGMTFFIPDDYIARSHYTIANSSPDKECSPGEIYQDCFRSKCEKRCDTLHDESLCPEDGSCIAGCFCAPGLVRKGEKCVRPERCHNCVCEGYGDPHYTTFDRLNYTFNGECSFVAARDKDPRGQHKFQASTYSIRCCHSCT